MAGPAEPDAPTANEGRAGDPFELCGVTIADKYRVVSLVGSGGFGVVYRAVHTGFGEPVAVKCLKLAGELGERERDALLSRLQDEGRVLHRLSKHSSGIVQALDVGAVTSPNDQWVPYLVMEWLEGETLADHLRARLARGEGAVSLESAIELLEPAARALDVAHRQKIAHRDVKPENLYLVEVSGKRSVKVLDFGIAKVLAQHATFTAAPAATQKQASAFTPSYGAPEQFNKKRGATGPWTDVFALALIVVEAVSGERALDGDDATQLYIAAADPAGRPTLRHKGVQTSDAVDDVLSRALSVEPADRYQDAGSFWDALREAAGKRAPRSESSLSDVSETGDFLSRHDLDLEPEELSVRRSRRDEDGDEDEDDGAEDALGGISSRPPRPPAQRARAAERRPVSAPAAIARPRPSPRPPRREPPPAITTTSEPATSSRWLPVVVVLALAGAALLYLQLRQIGPSDVDSSRSAAPIRSAAGSDPLDPALDADAGDEDDLDAGDDADAEAGVEFEPPEAMVFVQGGPQPEDGGFFIDAAEVTVADYRACVNAGRCVPATRVVLTEESARALGVIGVDADTNPEQLVAAWGPRCNEVRGAADHPVNCVNHGTAADYCRFVEKRLPTSKEWTLAAGGGSRRYPWGDAQPECGSACFGLNGSCLGSNREVASCASGARKLDVTPEGLVDLAGNVAEWVGDDAKGAGGGPWRLVRGGSFTDESDQLRTTTSRSLPAVTAHVTIGLRCAIDAPEGWLPPGPEP